MCGRRRAGGEDDMTPAAALAALAALAASGWPLPCIASTWGRRSSPAEPSPARRERTSEASSTVRLEVPARASERASDWLRPGAATSDQRPALEPPRPTARRQEPPDRPSVTAPLNPSLKQRLTRGQAQGSATGEQWEPRGGSRAGGQRGRRGERLIPAGYPSIQGRQVGLASRLQAINVTSFHSRPGCCPQVVPPASGAASRWMNWRDTMVSGGKAGQARQHHSSRAHMHAAVTQFPLARSPSGPGKAESTWQGKLRPGTTGAPVSPLPPPPPCATASTGPRRPRAPHHDARDTPAPPAHQRAIPVTRPALAE